LDVDLLCNSRPLVVLGAGAALAGAVSAFPQLIWLSEHKAWIFGSGAILIALSLAGHKFSTTQKCPVDQKENCETTRKQPIGFCGFLLAFI
jgi:hypothetical protein